MAKKLIITEEQYTRLYKILTETEDVEHTLSFVKIDDILTFRLTSNLNIKIKIISVNHANGEILGKTEKGQSVKFFFKSYNEANKQFSYKLFDKTTKQYRDELALVKSVDILRNNRVVQIPNVNTQQQQTDNQYDNNVDDTNDNVSEPIELDPNTPEDNQQHNQQNNKYKYEAGSVYNALTNDQELKKLMNHTSWWGSFTSELMGKKTDGKGILNALNFFNNYQNEKLDKKLGSNFVVGKWVEYEVLDPFTIQYEGPNGKLEELTLNVGSLYKAINQRIDLNDNNYNYKFLKSPGKNSFNIYVKEKTNDENIFMCDIVKKYHNKQGEWFKETKENIRIKFIPSEGYRPINN